MRGGGFPESTCRQADSEPIGEIVHPIQSSKIASGRPCWNAPGGWWSWASGSRLSVNQRKTHQECGQLGTIFLDKRWRPAAV